jgi:uncharacterized membrane protein SpoIIM required for sporulation
VLVNTRDQQASQRLEELIDRAEGLGRPLPFDELRELARTYRLSSARLAILRSRWHTDPDEIRYLNALCVRALSYLRVGPRGKLRWGRFFMADLPATLAATAWLQAVTAMLMLAGALIGVTVVAGNPAALYACIPANMYPPERLEQLADSSAQRAEFLQHTQIAFGLKSIFSASLFVHNVQVGLASFATGILAGVPTVILVVYNGLTLGAFAWIFSRDPAWPAFWAWILPHGILELLAVNLCSTGGLLIARAVIVPGRAGRADAIHAATKPAVALVVAALPLFAIAAGIESFLRQSSLSTGARYAAAIASVAGIVGYIWYVRRLAQRRSQRELDWLLTAGRPGESQGSGSALAP